MNTSALPLIEAVMKLSFRAVLCALSAPTHSDWLPVPGNRAVNTEDSEGKTDAAAKRQKADPSERGLS